MIPLGPFVVEMFRRKGLFVSGVKSTGPSRAAIGALLVSVGTLIAASVMIFREPVRKADKTSAEEAAASEEPLKKGFVRIGGVQRPETDVESKYRDSKSLGEAADLKLGYGNTPVVMPDANPHTASVAEALATKTHPERLTPAILPAAFNREFYERDPQAYINTIEPGRVFQPAQPGQGVFPLRTLTPRLVEVEQGQSIPLRVRVQPGAPVTFTSFDLGQFENQLNSITVRADDRGIATVRFTGSPGTINDVNIMAASPLNSGQAKFVVNVSLPRPAGAADTKAGGV